MAAIDDGVKICSKHGVYVDLGSGVCPECEKEKNIQIDELNEKYPLDLDPDEEDEDTEEY